MTQDEIIDMARQAGASMLHGGDFAVFGVAKLEALIKLATAKEREACAKVCETKHFSCPFMTSGAQKCADAIRARKEKP